MTEQEILKYNYTNDGRNYVLLGNTRWIAFTRNVIENKLIPKFGRDFNLVVYWHNNSSDETVDYICVPYTKVSILKSPIYSLKNTLLGKAQNVNAGHSLLKITSSAFMPIRIFLLTFPRI